MNMAGARPQVTALLASTALSVVLWFVPYGEFLTYPFRLFVTFIHEGGHAIAALLTGNSVQSLSVAVNGSGETYTTQGGLFSQMLIASAGYLGSMAFGALLLALIRNDVAPRVVLTGSALVLFALTIAFGLVRPVVAGGALSGIPFTVLAGMVLAGSFLAAARFTGRRVGTFLVCVLAVQCVLNALADLRTLFFISSPFAAGAQTDAQNMADATHVPAIFWTGLWIIIACTILALAVRQFVGRKDPAHARALVRP